MFCGRKLFFNGFNGNNRQAKQFCFVKQMPVNGKSCDFPAGIFEI